MRLIKLSFSLLFSLFPIFLLMHTPCQHSRHFPPGCLSWWKFLFAMKINFGKRHSKGLFFPGCPKIDLVHRMPQIIAFGNFILLMIYFLYDQYDKCEAEQSGLWPDAGEVWGREGSTGLPCCVSHEAEKQFSQTKGYRQGGIFSMINANDVTTFPPPPRTNGMGVGGGRKARLSGITAFP